MNEKNRREKLDELFIAASDCKNSNPFFKNYEKAKKIVDEMNLKKDMNNSTFSQKFKRKMGVQNYTDALQDL